MADEIKYYHGGEPCLNVGDLILPPFVTGVKASADYMPDQSRVSHVRTDRVFLATDIQAAFMFASAHPSKKGRVYEVTPIGELTPDPDCSQHGLSWEAESAKIISIIDMTDDERQQVLRAFMAGGL